MRFRIAVLALLMFVGADSALSVPAETGIAGKWATATVATAKNAPKPKITGKFIEDFSRSATLWAVALELDLKVSKGKLKGKVHLIVSDEKFSIEKGVVTGNRFTFETRKKVADVEIPNLWEGELKDANTLAVRRLSSSGKPLDADDPDGVDIVDGHLVLHRAK